ncbi:MAG: aldolase/citrate lyase family protein [Bryobacterales bacterium]|nr:aldolase/citrate lyase family protein [Bryobacteraceae bacterium]MDW8129305.1 aldolase/citrate lyase family protein [Bryobacterales bacterium]
MSSHAPPEWENPVRRTLREGRPVVGITVTTPSIEIAARAAALGFDFLWIEMEHAPITLESLRAMVLACRGLPAVPFARVPVNELWTAKRVLDMGVHGVIFPFTSTPELARQAVAACRYPPHGRRGCGPSLAMLSWPEPDRYHDSADENIMVVAVIEERQAIQNIEAIAAVEGIDVLFIGTADLSFSLGLRGRQDDPLHADAVASVLDAARRHGKIAGRPARDAAEINRFIQQGFLFFQATNELNLLADGARQLLAPLGKYLAPGQRRTIYG